MLRAYADVTGHAPLLPGWAAGFWQCKLRYRTQDELLDVAREYHRRGLPLAVIVADFFHWTRLGDWRFDPAEWPDPAAMVAELDAARHEADGLDLALGQPGQRELRRDGRAAACSSAPSTGLAPSWRSGTAARPARVR